MLWSIWLLSDPALAGFIPYETSPVDRIRSFVGVFLLALLCWAASENRRAIAWRTVGLGIALQLGLAALLLNPVISDFFFRFVGGGVTKLLSFAGDGATFVFQSIEPHVIRVGDPATLAAGGGEDKLFLGTISPPVKTFAFWILPTIIFFSALMNLLYYYGVMQVIVQVIGRVMQATLRTSGAESLNAAANIFVGQTEAPLIVRPYIAGMTRSELMALMAAGFATAAGGVMGAYVLFLKDVPNIAGHLMAAQVISATASLVCAKLMVPETGAPVTLGEAKAEFKVEASNGVEAAARGASSGLQLALNVAAMLIAVVALVALFDWIIGLAPVALCDDGGASLGYQCVRSGVTVASHPLSLSVLLGWVFAPIAWIMGVPTHDTLVVGRLLGQKMVLTEFIAYIKLGDIVSGPDLAITQRGATMCAYALCGFANFASIGIQIGGLGAMAPTRMSDFASLGFKAMLCGTIASCMSATVAGILI